MNKYKIDFYCMYKYYFLIKRAMTPLYYRDANAAILVFDVTDSKSFDSMSFWLKELDSKVKAEGLVLALAGNKCDVDEEDRKVSKDQA